MEMTVFAAHALASLVGVVIKTVAAGSVDGIAGWVMCPFLELGMLAEHIGKHARAAFCIGVDASQESPGSFGNTLPSLHRLGLQQGL